MNQDPDNYPYDEKDYTGQPEAQAWPKPTENDSTRTRAAAERIADALEAIAEDLHHIAASLSVGVGDLTQILNRILRP